MLYWIKQFYSAVMNQICTVNSEESAKYTNLNVKKVDKSIILRRN